MFTELKNEFLKKYPDYSNDINNFMNYLENENIPFESDITIQGIKTERIIASLKYNIDRQQIKKKETARKYLVAVGQLFEFLLDKPNISNEELRRQLGAPSNRQDSYNGICSKFIDDCDDLEDKESYNALTEQEIKKLIQWCDNSCVDEENYSDRVGFKKLVAALCIKLMIFTGITYRVARSIKFKDLDTKRSTIMINGFQIRLPLNLSVQFLRYSDFCVANRIINQDTEPFLFVNQSGEQWGTKTASSNIPNFLNSAIGKTDISGIVKYGITQLMNQDVNDSFIMSLTGASRELLTSCAKPNVERTWEAYINSKLVKTDMYYTL